MNSVKIELAINIDGVCSKTMPYDKAQQLYNELAKIFYRPQANYRGQGDIQLADGQTIKAGSINIPEPQAKNKTNNQLRDKINSRIDSNSVSTADIKSNPIYDRMADVNTRIDAARERAAARTSNCGSSRSC